MATSHPLEAGGVLLMAATVEVAAAIQTYVVNCVRRLVTRLLDVGSAMIHISKLHHLALALMLILPPTSHNNSLLNNSGIPTLVQRIILPTTLVT